MQTKNRPKYVTELVRKVNKTLQTLGKQGENSDLHIFITSYLLDKKMYHGWNYYKDKYVNGKPYQYSQGQQQILTIYKCIDIKKEYLNKDL